MRHNNKIINLYQNRLIQKIFIVAVIILVFWHGIWDAVPRADQIPYLHQISQFHNFFTIIKNSYAWNRVIAGGDELLFRPILYIQLGTFYYIFGYNFVLWQLSSLVMHILVVLAVHSLLLKSSLRQTLYPLLLSLLLGVAFTSSELVFWHHIGGYLLFCLLSVYSIIFLIKFFETKNVKFVCIALILTTASEFTYELGFVLNIFVSIVFLYRRLFFATNNIPLQKLADECVFRDDTTRGTAVYSCTASTEQGAPSVELPKMSNENQLNSKLSIIFIITSLLYPLLSIYNLHSMGLLSNIHRFKSMPDITNVSIFYYAKEQIYFWFTCLLLPSKIHIISTGRSVIDKIDISQSNIRLYYVNLFALKALFFSLIFRIIFNNNIASYIKNYNAIFSCFLSTLFIYTYSLIISYGRTAKRGIDYTLLNNIYYSYIPYAIAIVGIALYSYNYGKITTNILKNNYKYHNVMSFFKYFLNIISIISLAIIVVLNGAAVFKLGKNIRFDYSIKKLEVIKLLKTWAKSQDINSNEYFVINNCIGNDKLEWFEGIHIRKNSGWKPPFTLADALWPEKSFMLNKKKLEKNKNYSLKNLNCL